MSEFVALCFQDKKFIKLFASYIILILLLTEMLTIAQLTVVVCLVLMAFLMIAQGLKIKYS